MILFGWPRRTKEYGPAFYYECPACGRLSYQNFTKARRWLSIYFIPLLPIERADYYSTCSVCGYTEEIESKEEAKRYKQAAELTDSKLSQAIPDEEYHPQIYELMEESERIEVRDLEDRQGPDTVGFQ